MTNAKDPVKVHVGQLILNAYRAKGLTRYDVANTIGVNIRSVTTYTQGDGLPKGEKRGQLERMLGWREGAIQEAIVAGPATSEGPAKVRGPSCLTFPHWSGVVHKKRRQAALLAVK